MDIEKTPASTHQVPEDPKLLSKDFDVANQILVDAGEYADDVLTEEEDQKLRRKIDWRLIPIVSLFRSACLTEDDANWE